MASEFRRVVSSLQKSISDAFQIVVEAKLPKFTPRKTHPAGGNIYEVEVDSEQEEDSEEENEVNLEDAVQEESDAKSGSHVIVAFLDAQNHYHTEKEGESDQW